MHPYFLITAASLILILIIWYCWRLSTRAALYKEECDVLKHRIAILEERLSYFLSMESDLETSRQTIQRLSIENAELKQSLKYENENYKDKIQTLQQWQEQLSESFKSLSSKALLSNNESFMQLAKNSFDQLLETTKTDLGQRHKSIGDLLEPVHKSLSQVDEKLQHLEKERLSAYVDLRRQVQDLITSQTQLRSETANLVKALRNPTSRGQWGEMQLRRVVEMSGMISHCDFIEQKSLDDGRLRPDLIVHLPGGKQIVVDAKTALSAYLEAIEAPDETQRQLLLEQHAVQVRTHIKVLSQRAYWEQFESSPEFVVMFLPGESFFSAALEKDPSLIEFGVKEKVILATPTTLIALLRAVAFGWRQESITENARAVGELGRALYKRLSDMTGHLNKLGRHVGQTVDTYNQVLGTFERRVLVTARRFSTLDTDLDPTSIESINPLDSLPRSLQSEEQSDKLRTQPHTTNEPI